MVVKIQPAAKNLSNAVNYNERKMDGPETILREEDSPEDMTGHVVATVNVPDTSTLENEFARLKLKNERGTRGRKLENPAFHMSINPGEQDIPMDEATVVKFTAELMENLGYGQSPYRIYRHDDTERTHYHVVTTRIGQDGKKVRDSFENMRCENICRELATKYGYIYGLDVTTKKVEDQSKTHKEEETAIKPKNVPSAETSGVEGLEPAAPTKPAQKAENKAKKTFVPPFSVSSSVPAKEQYISFHKEAMRWSFTTPEQYAALLRWRFNTEVKAYNDKLYYIGLDGKGNGCTPPNVEDNLGLSAMREMLQRCADTDMRKRKSQRLRLERIIRESAAEADSYEAFRKDIERKGVLLAVSWTENDEPFGLTWMDRGTRCIWKGSETDITLQWLKDTAADRGWKLKRHYRHEKKSHGASLAAGPHSATQANGESGSMSKISTVKALRELLTRNGIVSSNGGGNDARKNGGRLRYGEEENTNEIII